LVQQVETYGQQESSHQEHDPTTKATGMVTGISIQGQTSGFKQNTPVGASSPFLFLV
jgi:hypothetical protein